MAFKHICFYICSTHEFTTNVEGDKSFYFKLITANFIPTEAALLHSRQENSLAIFDEVSLLTIHFCLEECSTIYDAVLFDCVDWRSKPRYMKDKGFRSIWFVLTLIIWRPAIEKNNSTAESISPLLLLKSQEILFNYIIFCIDLFDPLLIFVQVYQNMVYHMFGTSLMKPVCPRIRQSFHYQAWTTSCNVSNQS